LRRKNETTWRRRQQFEHFKTFIDQYFAVTILGAVFRVLIFALESAFEKFQVGYTFVVKDAAHDLIYDDDIGLFSKKFQIYLNN
jgi:hypothetical protein